MGFIVMLSIALTLLVVLRIWNFTIMNRGFLVKQSELRANRVVQLPVQRGIMFDRNNEVLAASVPVDSVWYNGKSFDLSDEQIHKIASILNMDSHSIKFKLKDSKHKGLCI